jgi:hypothetical protein
MDGLQQSLTNTAMKTAMEREETIFTSSPTTEILDMNAHRN